MISSRQRKALRIYLTRRIQRLGPNMFAVKSRKGKDGMPRDPWLVTEKDGMLTCTCRNFGVTYACAHCAAVERYIAEGEPKMYYDDKDCPRPTYPQDWPKYRLARRTATKAMLPMLVAVIKFYVKRGDIGARKGRKPIFIGHVLFAFAIRVINSKSEIESDSDVASAFSTYWRVTHPPSGPTVTRVIRTMEAVGLIERLIFKTGAVAQQSDDHRYMIDGCEFNIPNKDTNDPDLRSKNAEKAPAKKGKRRTPKIPIEVTVRQKIHTERSFLLGTQTVKIHPLVHYATKLTVAAIVTTGKASDGKQAVPLLEKAKNHTITEFIADKAYSSKDIYQYCEDNNILALIPPKENYIADEDGPIVRRYTARWRAKASELPQKYSIRNIAESGHSVSKRIYYEDLRSRRFLSQQAEALFMELLKNVRRLAFLYIVEGMDIEWLDDRCRSILDPARAKAASFPDADLSPRFHDGVEAA